MSAGFLFGETLMAILRFADMPTACGMSTSTVRRMVAAGDFPPPIRLGQRTVGWQSETIEAWLQARTAKATGAAGAGQ
jgi:prophage regulatory protein